MLDRRGFVSLMSTSLAALAGCRRGSTTRPGPSFGIAPAFTATDANGKTQSLDGLLASGPAVLVFYRGHW